MNTWLARPLVDCLGWTLVHFLWQGAVIAGLLVLAFGLLRHNPPNHRYLAGCAALLLMSAAPVVTFRFLAQRHESAPVSYSIPAASAPLSTATPPASLAPKILLRAKPMARELSLSERLESFLPRLVTGWLVGVLGLSSRLLLGWLQIRRLQRHAIEPLAEHWHMKLAELAGRLDIKRRLRLLQSACVEVPAVIGWLRPVILLPSSCLLGLTPGQLESILAHELAHIRRHDYPVNLLQSVVETVLFYHPAVWWVSRRIRRERENCCDDLAVEICGDRIAYARALATLEELRQVPAQLALAADGAPLLDRIRRLLAKPEPAAGRSGFLWAGVILAIVTMALTVGFRGNRAVAADSGKETTNTQTSAVATNTIAAETPAPDEAGRLHLAGSHSESATFGFKEIAAKDATAGQGRKTILSKLDRIQIASIKSDGLPLNEVIHNLSAAVKSHDPDGTGINFLINQRPPTQLPSSFKIDPNTGLPVASEPPAKIDVGAIKVQINPALTDLPLRDVLDVITKTADQPIDYAILDYVVVFSLRDQGPPPLEIRTFRLRVEDLLHWASVNEQTNGTARPIRGFESDPSEPGNREKATKDTEIAFRRFFASLEIDFNTNNPANIGKTFIFNYGGRALTVRSTARDLEKIKAAIQALDSNSRQDVLINTASVRTNLDGLSGLPKALPANPLPLSHSTNIARDHLPSPAVFARTNQTWTPEAREAIFSKLRRIKIDSIKYDQVPLAEVIKNLGELARSGDPDGTGIRFLLDGNHVVSSPSHFPPNNAKHEMPVWSVQDEGAELRAVRIKINPALTQLRLSDALDAIVKTADQPIKYSILDYAVVISFQDQGPPPLEIRKFRVDRDAFRAKLASMMGFSPANITGGSEGGAWAYANAHPSQNEQLILRFFNLAGVDMSTNNPANLGKTFIFNEKKGMLTVRSTPQDLDMIEAVLATCLNNPAPQAQSGPNPAQIKTEAKPNATNSLATGFQEKSAATDEAWPKTPLLTAAGPDEPPRPSMEARFLHFDLDRVLAGLKITEEMAGTNKFSTAVEEVFAKAGVDSNTGNSRHARAWLGHDWRREVAITGTPAELDKISAVLDQFQPRPQVDIKIKFVKVTEGVSHTKGEDWFLGGVKMSPITNQAEQFVEMPLAKESGNHSVDSTKFMVTNSLHSLSAGILDEPQLRAAMKALEQHEGIDIVGAPEITTEAGREAQIQIMDSVTVVTRLNSTPAVNGKTTNNYQTQQVLCGPMVDIVPQVSPDGWSLDLKLTVGKSEFLGYDDPREAAVYPPDTPAFPKAVKPLPHFRMQQLVTRETVNDGQTLVLRGFTSEEVITARDKIPMLGDLPLLGRLFRRSSSSKITKNVIVLITPTLVYPDGSRYNTDLQLARLNHLAVGEPSPAGSAGEK